MHVYTLLLGKVAKAVSSLAFLRPDAAWAVAEIRVGLTRADELKVHDPHYSIMLGAEKKGTHTAWIDRWVAMGRQTLNDKHADMRGKARQGELILPSTFLLTHAVGW